MYKQIFVLLALATVSYAQVVGWTDCGKFISCLTLSFSKRKSKNLKKNFVFYTQEAPQLSMNLELVLAHKHHVHLFVATLTTFNSMLPQVSTIYVFLLRLKLIFFCKNCSCSRWTVTFHSYRYNPWTTMDYHGGRCLRSVGMPNTSTKRFPIHLPLHSVRNLPTGMNHCVTFPMFKSIIYILLQVPTTARILVLNQLGATVVCFDLPIQIV